MQKKKIRVAMFIDNYGGQFIGGGQIQIKNLKQIFESTYNCQIDIFAPKKSGLSNRLFWNIIVIFEFYLKNRQRKYDLIHAHAYSPGFVCKMISIFWHKPLIYTVHGANSLDIKNDPRAYKKFKNFKFEIKYCLEKFLLTKIRYDQVISVSQNFLKYENINKNIEIIPNGIEIINKQKSFTKNIKKKFILLFVGRLERLKNVDSLIRSLKTIGNKRYDFQLRIVGYGWEMENLKKLVLKLELENKVIFLGKLYDQKLKDEYLNADLFILPSISEGQPLTVLEAMVSRLPVLVSQVGHNPFMIEDKVNGFLCDWNNIKDGLQKALQNRSKWKLITENAYEMVSNEFSWQICAQKTWKVYQEVLSKYV